MIGRLCIVLLFLAMVFGNEHHEEHHDEHHDEHHEEPELDMDHLFEKLREVEAECHGSGVEVTVIDRGPGLPTRAIDDQCFLGCTYKIFGIVHDGKYNAEKHLEITTLLYPKGTDDYNKVKEIMHDCAQETSVIDKDCVLAASAMACFMIKTHAIGLSMLV